MNRTSVFYQQAKLILSVLPIISAEECFTLKGGTAINPVVAKKS